MGRPASVIDEIYRANYAGLEGARLVRIDGAYHFVMDDQPERFAEAVEDALRP
ncbi:MAG TPA: hypothetical protein VGB49_04795 [Caulobacteraceae bacterium]|jgi:pimeloyl-ACP methyl ester carboxylesterase